MIDWVRWNLFRLKKWSLLRLGKDNKDGGSHRRSLSPLRAERNSKRGRRVEIHNVRFNRIREIKPTDLYRKTRMRQHPIIRLRRKGK